MANPDQHSMIAQLGPRRNEFHLLHGDPCQTREEGADDEVAVRDLVDRLPCLGDQTSINEVSAGVVPGVGQRITPV